MNNLPTRKPHRLKDYDYSLPGAYFITICTANRENILWQNLNDEIAVHNDIVLSDYGKIAEKAIGNIPIVYSAVSIDCYIIMPNHIHMLLQIHADESGRAMRAPTIDKIICQMKGYITKQIGCNIWQKLYYDHIVRNLKEYEEIAEYIYNNPFSLHDDSFYYSQD